MSVIAVCAVIFVQSLADSLSRRIYGTCAFVCRQVNKAGDGMFSKSFQIVGLPAAWTANLVFFFYMYKKVQPVCVKNLDFFKKLIWLSCAG